MDRILVVAGFKRTEDARQPSWLMIAVWIVLLAALTYLAVRYL